MISSPVITSSGMNAHVPLVPEGLAGAGDHGLVDSRPVAGEVDEPVLLHGPLPACDLAGAGDLEVQSAFLPLGPGEPVLVDDAALSRLRAAAHDTGGLDDLPVLGVVAVSSEVVRQVVGGFRGA
jgi:hypothetical protein